MSFTKHSGAASHSVGGPSESEIREQLRRILDSRAFRGSRRCITFLEYAVAKTLAGQADLLKERNLAVGVFERAPDTNLIEDTTDSKRRFEFAAQSADGSSQEDFGRPRAANQC